jgi:exonuclease SbcC
VRILSISGENLASLPAFEVALDRGPLRDAGLFALVGPTGAGKSTILDAMCLALFGDSPRSHSGSRYAVPFGEALAADRLQSNDPRLHLRRGASSARASVTFVAPDGRTYRASWAVQRARTGKLKDVTRELVRLEGDEVAELLADKVTAVDARVTSLLRMDFQQFRRSVLLAQGDFAALLTADPNTRAELLEAVTGTTVYGRISTLVYERSQARLGTLTARHEALAEDRARLLPDTARADLEARRDQAATKTQALAAERAEVEQQLAALTQTRALEEAVAQATATLADAEARWQALAPQRLELSTALAARALAPTLDAADAAAAQLTARRAELTLATQAELDATARLAEATLARTNAEAALAAQTARERTLAPQLALAQQLDRELGEERRLHQSAEDTRASAARRVDEAALAEAQARTAAAAVEQTQRETDAALAALACPDTVAAQWLRLDAELTDFVETSGRAQAARARLNTSRQALATAETTLEAERERLTERSTEEARAEAAQREAQAALLALDDASLARQEHALTERTAQLQRLGDVLRAALTAAARLEASLLAGQQARTRRAEAERAGETTARAQASAEGAEQEARAQHATTSAIVAVSAHRHLLTAGEPCALCGATEHPWAGRVDPVSELLEAARARLAAAEQRAVAARAQARAAGEAQASALTAEANAEASAREAREVAASTSAQWARATEGLEAPRANEAQAWLEARTAACLTERTHLEQRRATLGAARTAELAASEHAHAARQATTLAREAHASALEATHAAQQRQTREHEALQRDEARLGTLRTTLEAAWPGQPWAEAPARFAEDWRSRVAERQRVLARLAALGPKREQTARAALEATARLEAARTELTRATERAAAHTGRCATLEADRRAQLGGVATAAFLATQQAALHQARAALSATTEQAHAQQTQAEVARREASQRQAGFEAASRADTERQAALTSQLARLAWPVATLRAELARPGGWLEALEATLREADTRRTAATGALEAATSRLALAPRPAAPTSALPGLESRAQALETEWQRAVGVMSELEAQLGADTRDRARLETALAELAREEAASAALAELNLAIGSKDGAKFNRFAQSLNMERLVLQANEHLRDFAPRYELLQIPEEALRLQVIDRDCGGERRSVESLSGGETFLVSLALALGLSSLSSQGTRVETLFIDEGFGSLDPDTMEKALGVLEALRATGRQVGIISHVPGLAERVGALVRVERTGTGTSQVRVEASSA